MTSIRGSKTNRPSSRLKASPRKPKENNLQWLARHWPKATDNALLLLVGGASPLHFRLRAAQSTLRHDLSPSHWSHVALIARGATGAPLVWECSLEPRGGFNFLPTTNGLSRGSLEAYKSAEKFPNIALLGTSAVHSSVLSKERLNAFRNQRDVLNAVELVHAWLGYVWGVGEHRNPLDHDLGVPSAAVLEVLIGADGLDLTPGRASRSSSPESLWQAAKWWHLPADADKDLKLREMSGSYVIQDVLGAPGRSGH